MVISYLQLQLQEMIVTTVFL